MKGRRQKAKKEQSRSLPSDDVIAELQQMLLSAVLGGQSLPGRDQSISFPDLSFVLSQSNVILADSNLARALPIKASPKPVQVLSVDSILPKARSEGNVTYLAFQKPEIRDDTVVRLTLEAKIAPQDPDQRTLGLSAIQVEFRKVGDRWLVLKEPILSAS